MKYILYKGDAIKGLDLIQDKSIDMIITDPPYNISQNKNKKYKFRKKPVIMDFGDWDHYTEEEYIQFTERWFSKAVKKLKDKGWIVIFFSMERLGYFTNPINGLFNKYGINFKTLITWHKRNAVPQFFKNSFISSCEYAIVGSKGKSTIPNYLGHKEMHNFYETNTSSNYSVTKHPTEKPESMFRWLIKILSNADDTILDPFLGSGTTMVSALKERRSCIGFEINDQYINEIKKRMNWGSTLDPNIIFEYKEVDENGMEL